LSNSTYFINPVDTCTVTAVHFLAPYPALAVADNRGGITLWAIYPSLHKYRQPLPKGSNVSSGDRDAFVRKATDMVNFAVVCMRFNSDDCSLYSGDDKGRLVRWDVKDVLEAWNLTPFMVGDVNNEADQRRLEHAAHGTHHLVKAEALKNRRIVAEKEFKTTEKPIDAAPPSTLPSKSAKLVSQVMAHKESISSIQFVEDPPCLVTASLDCLVRVWKLNLDPLGTLTQQHTADNPWKFNSKRMIKRREGEKQSQANNLIGKLGPAGTSYLDE
jgi:WD40 repeat protein